MNESTHKTVLAALRQLSAEQEKWLTGLGVSEAAMVSAHDAAIQENGMLAGIVIHRKGIAIPGVSVASATAQVAPVIAWFRSPGFAADLLKQPEPTSEELAQFFDGWKNGLARVRQQLIDSTEFGPRQKRGKGTNKIEGLIKRDGIRREIKELRDSRVLLKDIYERLGERHGVSATTIKRIWLEKRPRKEHSE